MSYLNKKNTIILHASFTDIVTVLLMGSFAIIVIVATVLIIWNMKRNDQGQLSHV